MKAAYRYQDSYTIKDTTLRPLKPHEARLHIYVCGICGTDIHPDPDSYNQEKTFGHEMAGRVLEIGSAVTGIEVGDEVAVESSTPCGRCDNCRNGRQELCTRIQSFFLGGTFGFAEEAIVPAISLIPCADLSPELRALSEPLGVAIDLVRLAEIGPDNRVLILGQGPIGLMALALVKRLGVEEVFVSDFASKTGRKKLAETWGANEYLDPVTQKPTEYDFGGPIDRVLVTSPPPTLTTAFSVASKGGMISFIGIGHGDLATCTFDVNEFHFKKLQLHASFASPALYTAQALDLLRNGAVDGEALISHRFPLAQIGDAMQVAASDPDAVKVMVAVEQEVPV